MKNTPHIIEIDAEQAFKSVGVDLRIIPFAGQCVAALRDHVNKCITQQLVIAALSDATATKKRRRKTSVTTTTQIGGLNDER